LSRFNVFDVFTALHGMQTRSSDENSVRPSVCQTRDLWQNERMICPDFFPRCMECQRGLAMTKVSVRLSNAWTVTKRKKNLSRFLYHTVTVAFLGRFLPKLAQT